MNSSLLSTTSLTGEQHAIISHVKEKPRVSLLIDAGAGCGKTSTLLELFPYLKGSWAVQAFNKAIATEISTKANARYGLAVMLNGTISTVHSHGLSAFRKAGRKTETLSGKVAFLTKDWLKTQPGDDDVQRNGRHITKLVGMAKAHGFGLQSSYENFPSIADSEGWLSLIEHFNLEAELEGDFDTEELIEAAQHILTQSNKREGTLDFDDMIYLPLLLNLPIPQFDTLLLDEAQDINATRRELAFRSIKPNGRIIAVGDPNQAIYGFTGASVDSLKRIRDRADADTLTLSICWRCDSDIVKAAQRFKPSLQARPNAPAGIVRHVQFLAPPRTRCGQVAIGNQAEDFLDMPQAGDAILCRLNKPNVAVALGLLRRGQRARIEGRDLGRKLLDHAKKANGAYVHIPLDELRLDLDEYMEVQCSLLLSKKREGQAALLQDEIEAVQLLIDRCLERVLPNNSRATHSFADLEALIESLFADNIPAKDTITLASLHKAKGREWPRVFVLGYSDYMPFHRATLPWELEQEDNLRYVALTRAERELVLVHGVQSALDKGEHRNVRQPAQLLAAAVDKAKAASAAHATQLLAHRDVAGSCFNCGTSYGFDDEECPRCGATGDDA